MKKHIAYVCIVLVLTSCMPATPIPINTTQPSTTISRTPTALPLPSSTPTIASQTTPTRTPTPKATATHSPTWTITPTKPAIVDSCPGAPDILLKIGDWAMVSVDPPLPNKIRSQPGTGGEVTGWIQPGDNVLVVEGPRCADSYTWWHIRSLGGLEGWTVEGDASGYWLVDPIYAWYQLPDPLNPAGTKTYDLRELKITADLALVSSITGSYNPLATPMPTPLSPETPMPNDPRYSDFGTTSYAAHSFYTISGVIGDYFWVYDLTDPLSRYYLNNMTYDDCSATLRANLQNDEIIKASLDPFCGMNGGIPLLFKAGVKKIQFSGGSGVRYMIASGNYLTANSLTYHFQGLSDDGHYYITILIRPVLHPYIIEDQLFNGDFGWVLGWTEGQYEQAEKTYDLFNTRIATLLDAGQVTLYPSLEFLDEMMASIVIK